MTCIAVVALVSVVVLVGKLAYDPIHAVTVVDAASSAVSFYDE